jgi:hypothetical protein
LAVRPAIVDQACGSAVTSAIPQDSFIPFVTSESLNGRKVAALFVPLLSTFGYLE